MTVKYDYDCVSVTFLSLPVFNLWINPPFLFPEALNLHSSFYFLTQTVSEWYKHTGKRCKLRKTISGLRIFIRVEPINTFNVPFGDPIQYIKSSSKVYLLLHKNTPTQFKLLHCYVSFVNSYSIILCRLYNFRLDD